MSSRRGDNENRPSLQNDGLIGPLRGGRDRGLRGELIDVVVLLLERIALYAVRGLQKERCDERARRQSQGRERLYCEDQKILVVVPSQPWLDKYVRCRYVRSRLLKNTQA